MKNFRFLCLLMLGAMALASCSKDSSNDYDEISEKPVEDVEPSVDNGKAPDEHYGADNTTDEVVTGGGTGITFSSITLHGYINGLAPSNMGIVYDTDASFSNPRRATVNNFDTGTSNRRFTVGLNRLLPGTTYYYYAYTNFAGVEYTANEVLSFTTRGFELEVSLVSMGMALISFKGINEPDDYDELINKLGIFVICSKDREYAENPPTYYYNPDFSNPIVSADFKQNMNMSSYTAMLEGLECSQTYYYRCNYGNMGVKTFTTKSQPTAMSGAVDLGLSVKWAACNVGAGKPEDFGGRYAWGEKEEKSEYGIFNYFDENFTKYTLDNPQLQPSDDVAHVKLGGTWRMPTKDECQELLDKCHFDYITYNGVEGVSVTSVNGNNIFMPAANLEYYNSFYINNNNKKIYGGCFYWASEIADWHDGSAAYTLQYTSYSGADINESGREGGCAVRPVTP